MMRVRQAAEIAGFVGTIVMAIAYVPQIVHLARERCSAGVSLPAWLLWLAGSVLICTHAFVVRDVVFLTLQAVNIVAMLSVIVLSRRYANMICASHELAAREAIPSAPRE
jgi:uncharacterized protein with PQ loop repeat